MVIIAPALRYMALRYCVDDKKIYVCLTVSFLFRKGKYGSR